MVTSDRNSYPRNPSRLLNIQTGCSVKSDLRRRGYGHAPPPASSASHRSEQQTTHWSRTRSEMIDCPATMRIPMLEGVLGPRSRPESFPAWSRLSDATHPYPYELAPTAGELRRWHSEVTSLVGLLDPSADTIQIDSADDDERML